MGEYTCRVGTADGAISERVVVAESAAAARESLDADGLEVFFVRRRHRLDGFAGWLGSLRPRAGEQAAARAAAPDRRGSLLEILRRPLLGRSRRISASDLLLLTQELAALVRAGLPVLRCLEILGVRRSGTPAGEVLDRVRERVATGLDLSHAFELEGPAHGIPGLYVTTLRVGEAGGDLEGALRRYADHLERAQTLRQKVRGALLYPAVLFAVSLGVIGVLVGFVLPRFADFYANYSAQLPLPTRMLVGVAAAVRSQGLVIVLALPLVAIVVAAILHSEAGRARRDRWSLRLPLLGALRRLYLDVETSRTLATLLSGGAPLLEALRVAARGTENRAYRAKLHRVVQLVQEGVSLNHAFERAGLLDDMGLEMVEVGESTGSLETMLEHVSATYDETLERRLNAAVGLLEPAVLVTMGVFLAVVLLSLYLPLFNTVRVIG